MFVIFFCTIILLSSWGIHAVPKPNHHSHRPIRVDRRALHYQIDPDSDELSSAFHGSGREFNLFSRRGGSSSSSSSSASSVNVGGTGGMKFTAMSSSANTGFNNNSNNVSATSNSIKSRYNNLKRKRFNSSYPYSSTRNRGDINNNKSIFTGIKEWIQAGNLPKIQCRVEPNTTLKVRKTFRPLKTVIRLGADFNTQLGVWQFQSSWEDEVIGGKLTLAGRELQFSKTWLLSVGAVEDLVTRLRLRAAVDLGTMKAYARFGFRTERLSPINVVEGFTMMKRLPLDGNNGHVKLEVKANFAFPEPEIEYSTENHRSFIGMGDIEINIDELNLLLDY